MPRHRGRIVAGVDKSLLRTDGVAADDQAFEDPVRVAGEHGPVHEGRGLAFVAVDNDVLGFLGRVARRLPFQAGGKAAAAAAAQIGFLHLVQHLHWGHLRQRLGERFVAAHCDVVLDLRRIDPGYVAGEYAHLVLVERHLAHVHRFFAAGRIAIDQAIDDFALHRAGDDLGNVFWLDLEVADFARTRDNVRPLVAIAVTTGDPEIDLLRRALFCDFRSKSGGDRGRVQSVAGRAAAYRNAGFGRIARRDDLFAQFFQFGRRL